MKLRTSSFKPNSGLLRNSIKALEHGLNFLLVGYLQCRSLVRLIKSQRHCDKTLSSLHTIKFSIRLHQIFIDVNCCSFFAKGKVSRKRSRRQQLLQKRFLTCKPWFRHNLLMYHLGHSPEGVDPDFDLGLDQHQLCPYFVPRLDWGVQLPYCLKRLDFS